MNFNLLLRARSKKAVKLLPFRKSGTILCITFTLVFFLSSLGNANVGNINTLSTIAQATDSDGDGLSDDLETMLGTDKNNRSGDKDNDGLYDFEEYLDLYGTPDDTNDTPKYTYNNSTSYGFVLDIYHHFNLSSNKSDYLRDQSISTQIDEVDAVRDYLLWNVEFDTRYAGGSNSSAAVIYSNNVLRNVSFTGRYAGGSSGSGLVSYSNNIMTGVNFTGSHSGGTESGDVLYSNNTMTDVRFTGFASGSGHITSYSNNTMTEVSFAGEYCGGGGASVLYSNNTMSHVNFTGPSSGGSEYDSVSYSNNTMSDVSFTGSKSGGSSSGSVSYSNNSMIDVSFTGYFSGGSLIGNVSYADNIVTNILLSGFNASISLNGSSSYSDNVIVRDNYDTDNDNLGDGFELFESGTNSILNDTDGDGLADGWEVRYHGSFGVDALVAATSSELASDIDNDGLTLLEEAQAGTDPGTVNNSMTMSTTDSDVSPNEISEESSFPLLIILSFFTFFSLVLVVYRVRR